MCKADGVHLIGSVALPDAETVFSTLSKQLGPWLKRVPDGETGARSRWIYWQREMLMEHPDFELATDVPDMELYEWNGRLLRKTPYIRLKASHDPAKVRIEPGYAEAALASYETFKKLRADGVIPQGVRFQVSLPTPIASAYQYILPASIPDYLNIYEPALLRELRAIVDGVPHADLSIQWDVCQEVLIYENYAPYSHRPSDYKAQIADELVRLGNAVPADIEMGYHLCYGSPADAHLIMPKDFGIIVEMAQSFIPRLKRPLHFLHIPVPKDRTDIVYFEPLKALKLPKETELYLGLIHFDDADGDKARMAAACTIVKTFGVSTECGWGRTNPGRVPGLIAAHRAIMEAQ